MTSMMEWWSSWLLEMHSNYEAAMKDHPFGAPGDTRYWLHNQFLLLGTMMAVCLRVGLCQWLGKMVLVWLIYSPENWETNYQALEENSQTNDGLESNTAPDGNANGQLRELFQPDGWERACKRLAYDPRGWKPHVVAVLKLLTFHLGQAAGYGVIFIVYAPVLWNTSDFLFYVACCVLLRETVYAVSAVLTLSIRPGFMLYSMKHGNFWSNMAYIVFPDKVMIANLDDSGTWIIVSTALDFLPALGLVVGQNAQVLDLPIVVAWLVAAAPSYVAFSLLPTYCLVCTIFALADIVLRLRGLPD
ncbi:unnamed protein product [Durusdinium trenchii]|uniref:Glycerophosphocholine acyltransferase 1 n=1 Tax=Durusdinium trenchii TaxID=1381693 RepID=A0ABP0J1J0_9DINO